MSSRHPMEDTPLEELIAFAERLEPTGDPASFTRPKTEVLTIRLGLADMKRLKDVANRLGVGHSTLARMLIRNGLHGSAGEKKEPASSLTMK